jgi:aspartate aminotransferase-like enzyme
MAKRTYQWVDEMRERGIKLEVLAPQGYRSPSVTCIKVPEPFSGSRLSAEAKARGYVIASGYGALKDKTFRIGHMGDHTVEELDELLGVLQEILTA